MAGTAQVFGKLEQEPVGIITDLERNRRKVALGIEHRDPHLLMSFPTLKDIARDITWWYIQNRIRFRSFQESKKRFRGLIFCSVS
jgi:hypothetical protein